ncbi:MAG: hypothetical protein IPG78_14000 [Ignavibacteria bacterium]|nr:hypothetical protein [Ignavibacteria bacterium]
MRYLKATMNFRNYCWKRWISRNIRNIFINNLSTLSNELLSENFKTKNIDILLKIDPPVLDSAVLIKDMNSNNIEFQYLEQLNKENISEKTSQSWKENLILN